MLKLLIFFRIHPKIFFYANLCFHSILLQEMAIAQDVFQDEIFINGINYRAYQYTYDIKPALPSPFLSDGNREVVMLKTKDNKYALLDVTLENGYPFNYQGAIRGKGIQLHVDTLDFPTMAYTGLHSLMELSQIQSINGLSVAEHLSVETWMTVKSRIYGR
jgi:hypothetical protein